MFPMSDMVTRLKNGDEKSVTHPNNFSPALVYGINGKNDDGYNRSAYIGAERFKKDFGIDYQGKDCVMNEAQREQIVRNLARNKLNPIVGVAFDWENAFKSVAAEFPNTKFVIFNTTIDSPNVQSVHFDVPHVGFLAGALAAMVTKTKIIGTIIGSNIPIIQAYNCAFLQGVKHINKDIIVQQKTVDSSKLNGFSNPARGSEIAKSQIDAGVDIIFSIAGNTDFGVLKAVNDAGIKSIIGTSNKNSLSPSSILTSAVADLGHVVYGVFDEVRKGTWKPGVKRVGLKEKAVYLALDEFNRLLISTEVEAKIRALEKDIVDEKLQIIDYRVHNSCPLQ